MRNKGTLLFLPMLFACGEAPVFDLLMVHEPIQPSPPAEMPPVLFITNAHSNLQNVLPDSGETILGFTVEVAEPVQEVAVQVWLIQGPAESPFDSLWLMAYDEVHNLKRVGEQAWAPDNLISLQDYPVRVGENSFYLAATVAGGAVSGRYDFEITVLAVRYSGQAVVSQPIKLSVTVRRRE